MPPPSPKTKALTAQIIDGVVTIYGTVEVYFAGEWDGSLQPDGTFTGVWSGDAIGSNLEFKGEAHGEGTWNASPPA